MYLSNNHQKGPDLIFVDFFCVAELNYATNEIRQIQFQFVQYSNTKVARLNSLDQGQ